MLEPWTQQLTPCVTYDTKLATNQHFQATPHSTTCLQNYYNLWITSRIGARFYTCDELLCGELHTWFHHQCLPAVLCCTDHCYATTVAGWNETLGVHCAKQRQTTSQVYKPTHQFSATLKMVLRIYLWTYANLWGSGCVYSVRPCHQHWMTHLYA